MSTHRYTCGHLHFWEDDKIAIIIEKAICPDCEHPKPVPAESRLTEHELFETKDGYSCKCGWTAKFLARINGVERYALHLQDVIATSSALLPVGRPMCSECAGTKTMHDDNCPTLKPGWLERQSAVVNDNMKKLGELFPPALPVGRQPFKFSVEAVEELVEEIKRLANRLQWLEANLCPKHLEIQTCSSGPCPMCERDEFQKIYWTPEALKGAASLPVGESTPNDVKVLQELVEDYQKAVDGSGQHHLIAPEQVADRFRALRDLLREALPYIESGVKREVESPGSHQEFKDEAIDLLRRCKSASSKVGVGESREPLPSPTPTPLAERDCTICGQQLKNCKCPSLPAEIESRSTGTALHSPDTSGKPGPHQ